MKGEPRSIAVVILLSIVTCGIYSLVWVYQVSEELRVYLGDDSINPTLDVVLSLVTCGIYPIIWMYLMGQRVQRAQQQSGLPASDEGILYLILQLFGLGLVSIGIIQSKLNDVWESSKVL